MNIQQHYNPESEPVFAIKKPCNGCGWLVTDEDIEFWLFSGVNKKQK